MAIALVAGLTAGILSGGRDGGGPVLRTAETIGTVWVNGIRMTVIPLIVSLLIVGVAAPREASSVGALGARAFAFFYISLTVVAGATALLAPIPFRGLTLDPAGVAALRSSVAGSGAIEAAASVPSFADWVVGVVPTNPFESAASGALLPLIVFVLGFAYALTRIDAAPRTAVVAFFRGVADAMMVLVGWVLLLAPVGVLALTYVLGTRLGSDVVGAIGMYVIVQVALLIASALIMYPVAAVLGRTTIAEFARAVAPAQVVAVTTRSSFAALPAGLDGARRVLGIPAEVAGFVMPLAVAIFRYSSPIQWIVGALFIARIYGVEFGIPQLLTVMVASVLLNATVPGIPSGGLLVQAPVYAAVGLPVEGLAILIAVDLVPDLFRTTANATGHLAAATVLGAWHGRGDMTAPADGR